MQAASTYSRADIAAGHASSGRVTVLRCPSAAVLGEAVRDCVWSLAGGRARELVIPAGPYRYAYAAALHIARVFEGGEEHAGANDADSVLNRIDIAQALRPLVRANVVLGVPRLDALDPESVHLLASLVWYADLCAKAGLDAPFTLVTGITEEAPSPAMRKLLQLKSVHCADVANDTRGLPPPPTQSQRKLLAVLGAAPHPLSLELVAKCVDRPAEAAKIDLEQLATAGVVDLGDHVGQGSAFSQVAPDPDELESARQTLLERHVFNLPDARLALAGVEAPELARELGRRALDRGEPEIAVRCFRYGGRMASTGSTSQELAYATALAEIGAHDGAVAIFWSLEDQKFTPDDVYQFGLLASRLAEAGVLDRTSADQAMRKAERENRGGNLNRAVHIRVLRAQMMLRHDEAARALTLLRRVVREQLDQVTDRTKMEYQIVLARAYAASGSRRFAERALLQARDEARDSTQLMEIERALLQVLPHDDLLRDESERRAVKIAAERLDQGGAERVLGSRNPGWLPDVLAEVFEGQHGAPRSKPPHPSEGGAAMFAWLRVRGATLAALWGGGHIQVFPVGATARPGLIGWLQTALQRMADYPHATLTQAQAVPGAGPYAGDMVLYVHEWGDEGPMIVLLRREDVTDVNDLLAALGSPRPE